MEQYAGVNEQRGHGRRTWLMVATAAVALIAMAALAILLIDSGEDAVYEPGSPEAAVQAYAAAWDAGDADAAWALLTPQARARLTRLEIRSAMSWDEDAPSRIWIEQRRDLDDRVVLTLGVERTWDGLLGPDRDTHSLRLTLVELDDAWRIDTPVMGFHPW
jgi:hypothetical protein